MWSGGPGVVWAWGGPGSLGQGRGRLVTVPDHCGSGGRPTNQSLVRLGPIVDSRMGLLLMGDGDDVDDWSLLSFLSLDCFKFAPP